MIPYVLLATILSLPSTTSQNNKSTMFGTSVAGPGDMDGDGVPDLFIAAPGCRRSYLVSCKTSRLIGTYPSAWAVTAPGDLDGDGYPDLLVGSSPWDSESCAVALSGRDGRELHRVKGNHVATAGDLNRDGRPDFIIDHDVRSGRDGSVLLTIPGSDLQPAGDTNGDGSIDFVGIATPTARIYSGRDGSVLHEFSVWKERAASLAIGAGDLDRDGCADIVVGYPDEECNFGTGYVRVLSGKSGQPIHDLSGNDALFGATLLAPGDLDGDGQGDLVVGAYDSMGPAWGNVLVYSGATWKQIDNFHNDRAEAGFGTALAALGDVDGDGVTDLAVGACKGSAGGVGVAFVYSGKTRKVIWTLSPPTELPEGR